MKKPFLIFLSYYSVLSASFTTWINGVQKADLQHEAEKSKNMRSYFLIFHLTAQVKTLLLQPR